MKEIVLLSKLKRRATDAQEKSLLAHLFELSTLIAEGDFSTLAIFIASLTQSDAVLVRGEREHFSRNLSEIDQGFLKHETLPKLGQHGKLNSRLEVGSIVLGRFEIEAFSSHDKNLLQMISDFVDTDLLRHQQYRSMVKDAATGFWSREIFFDFFEQEFNRARRYHSLFSLVIMDIDGFSRLPNRDTILAKVAQRIRTEVREGDLIARIANNTFALLEPMTHSKQAAESASRLLNKFKHLPLLVQETPLQIFLSLGVACLKTQDESPASLFERADKALSAAKRLGGNHVVLDD